MDVFSADGVYLGTVAWIGHQRGQAEPHAATASATSPSTFSGEALGPMPTARIGNDGPSRQTPATAYASGPRSVSTGSTRSPAELLVLRMMVSLNWSTFRPRVWRLPVSLVQIVALERIILTCNAAELGA